MARRIDVRLVDRPSGQVMLSTVVIGKRAKRVESALFFDARIRHEELRRLQVRRERLMDLLQERARRQP